MNGPGKSDSLVVPGKPPNNGRGAPRPAEGVEGRGLAKGSAIQHNRIRTQCRVVLRHELDRARQSKEGKGTWGHAGLSNPTPSSACASDPRQEPSAVVPHAGICAGGGP